MGANSEWTGYPKPYRASAAFPVVMSCISLIITAYYAFWIISRISSKPFQIHSIQEWFFLIGGPVFMALLLPGLMILAWMLMAKWYSFYLCRFRLDNFSLEVMDLFHRKRKFNLAEIVCIRGFFAPVNKPVQSGEHLGYELVAKNGNRVRLSAVLPFWSQIAPLLTSVPFEVMPVRWWQPSSGDYSTCVRLLVERSGKHPVIGNLPELNTDKDRK